MYRLIVSNLCFTSRKVKPAINLSRLPQVLRDLIWQFAVNENLYYILTSATSSPGYTLYGYMLLLSARNQPRLMYALKMDSVEIIHVLKVQLAPTWSMYLPSDNEITLLTARVSDKFYLGSLNRFKHSHHDYEYTHFLCGVGRVIHRDEIRQKDLSESQLRFLVNYHRRLSCESLNVSDNLAPYHYMTQLIDMFTPPQKSCLDMFYRL